MQADDEAEYVEYVTGRLPVLRRSAYLLCGDGHRADDIVQSTLTALYRHWPRARAAHSVDAYVHRMLMRAYLDEARGRWSRVRLMAAVPDRAARPAANVEERDTVSALLARLSYPQRAVLVLRFACDLSIQDVATVLNCSTGNVKSHTSRGLAALRREMETRHVTGSDG